MLVANKKKPEPVKNKKSVLAKKKPEPVKKARSVPKKRKQPKTAESPVPKMRASIGGKDRLRRAGIAALALVCCFGIVLSAVSLHAERLQKKVTMIYSGVLQQMCLFPIKFEEDQVRSFVRTTKRRGQTGAFTYFCNTVLQLDTESRSGYILFGSPAGNDCELVMTVLDENGRVFYRSDGVLPGSYITQIQPYFIPESGVHTYTVYVTGYERQGDFRYKCVGVQYSRLRVEVGESS